MDKSKLWNETIDFYDELINKYSWKQEPMLEFVYSLKEVSFWDKYFPSGSHEALGLSLLGISENFEKPIVYIIYQSKSNNFHVYFQQGQNVLKEFDCVNPIRQDILNQIDKFFFNSNTTTS